MKKLLLINIIFFAVQFTYAQHHLDQTSTWVYYNSQWLSQTETKELYRTITIEGDSTIQGKTYFKRYLQGVDIITSPISSTINPIPKQFFDLVRDDVNFFYSYIDGQDSIVMDFTKEIGDVLAIDGICLDSIGQIDSVYLGSQALKKWTFDNYAITPYIEGVGEVSNLYLGNHCVIIGLSYGLVCYEKQGNQLILNSNINCRVYNSIRMSENKDLDIVVYPNPTIGDIYIQNSSYLNGEIKLFNLTGQLLRKKELEGVHVNLDMEQLPKGTYWLTITSDQKTIAKKIIKL